MSAESPYPMLFHSYDTFFPVNPYPAAYEYIFYFTFPPRLLVLFLTHVMCLPRPRQGSAEAGMHKCVRQLIFCCLLSESIKINSDFGAFKKQRETPWTVVGKLRGTQGKCWKMKSVFLGGVSDIGICRVISLLARVFNTIFLREIIFKTHHFILLLWREVSLLSHYFSIISSLYSSACFPWLSLLSKQNYTALLIKVWVVIEGFAFRKGEPERVSKYMNQKSRAPTAPLPRLTHGPLPAPDLLFL